MLRVIREVQPTWVIGENVPGLVNWSKGVVFEEVQSDLEVEGYEVQSFILPAAGVGAPHRRDRVWIVAYANKRTTGPSRTSTGTTGKGSGNNDEPKERGKQTEQHFGHGNVYGDVAYARLLGQEKRQQQAMGIEQLCKKRVASNTEGKQGKRMQSEQREFSQQRQREFRGDSSPMGCWDPTDPNSGRLPIEEHGQKKSGWITETGFSSYWQNFPTQSPVCNGDDGISAGLVRYILRTGGDCYTEEEAEKEAQRIISKVRNEAIKAGGNAVVPPLVLQLFRTIEKYLLNANGMILEK